MDMVVLTRAYFSYVWNVPILVTPICIVRRSRSLPDDSESTNQAPDLVDLADLNDLTSSKSGASGNSNDKQDQDGDEEADQFEDASPLTPVHSPKKKAGFLPLEVSGKSGKSSGVKCEKSPGEEKSTSSEKSSPGVAVVPQENSTRNLLLFTDGVVPVVNVTILRELGTPDNRPCFVRKSELDIPPSRGSEAKEEVKEDGGAADTEPRLEIERGEIEKDFTVYDTGPSTSTSATYRQERRMSIKRQGSLVKEKSKEKEIIIGTTDVTVAENASFETAQTSEDKKGKSVKDVVDETTRKLAKDRRKSLKEQESIERVNEYLAKHSPESATHNSDNFSSELSALERRRKSLKEIRPLTLERSSDRRQSLAVDMGLLQTPSERRKSLTKQEKVEIEIVGDNHEEELQTPVLPEVEIRQIVDKVEPDVDYGTVKRPDSLSTAKKETTGSFMVQQSPGVEDAESGKSVTRKSSIKKKESEKELDTSRRQSPGESGKKEVKIRENVEEILFEDSNEQVTTIPEVQLVRAKIISAEEAAANLSEKAQCNTKIELNSPPEIVTLDHGDLNNSEKLNVRTTKFRKAALSAEEDDGGLLNLPGLTKSTSENVLVETEEEGNTISGKNFKPDILLDLSKVPDEIEEVQEKSKDSVNSPKDKRVLSRVGSEGSKKPQEVKISSKTAATSSSLIASAVSLTSDEKLVTTTSRHETSMKTLGETSKPVNQTSSADSITEKISDSEKCEDYSAAQTVANKIIGEDSTDAKNRFGAAGLDSKPESVSDSAFADHVDDKSEKVITDENRVNGKLEATKAPAKPEVITKTVYKSDFPINTIDCSYKSANQRLREREFSAGSFSPKGNEPFVSKLQQPSESSVVTDGSAGQRIQQILTTDKEAEEQRQKALEKQREHEKFLQQRRIEGEINSQIISCEKEEDNIIGKEHSLEYQSQTLEARLSAGLEEPSKSADNLLIRGDKEDRAGSSGNVVADYQERRERREAETQTQQETKSTQCGTDEVIESCLKQSAKQSLSSLAESPEYNFGSPRKEVQTQTQGETKGTQCGPDDLAETFSQLKTFFRQKSSAATSSGLQASSPRKEVEVQTEQESKSVQCSPDDIPDSPLRSSIYICRKPGGSSKSIDHHQHHHRHHQKREVEVQTYQESKSTQFSSEDLGQSSASTSESKPEKFLSITEPIQTTSLYTSSPIIVLVDGRTDMTVTHNYKDKDGNVVWAKHWGPERMVEIYREPKSSLGLSIVGGKVDLYHGGPNTSQNISGIFIKNVLPNSPAGRTGDLKTGDRIIEVDGVDLRNSTHDRAVKAIQAAGNPVCLLVQSLVHLSPDEERTSSRDTEDNSSAGGRGVRRQGTRGHGAIVGAAPATPTTSFRRKPPAVSPARTITPELIQEGIEDEAKQGTSRSDFRRQSTKNDSDGAGPSARRSSMKHSLRKKAPSPPKGAGILREVSEEGEDQPQQTKSKPKYSSDESSDEEDTRDLEGNVYTKAGIEISRRSAGNVKRTREEIEADPEQEDEFGYTAKKIKKRYDALGHPVVMVRLEKDRRGLGISLAGHKDRNRMAVFVCGLNPKGVAHKTGGLNIGDEILEVNGTVLQGRCHLNASAMIKGMPGPCFKVIVLRRSTAVNDLAVKPIVQFPPTLDEDDPERFSQYKGVRTVSIKKGQYGLGIMIIEGKHAEVGQGIFVSDIQEGSAAEQAGLQVGDMILAVNLDCLLGSNYDEATSLLKKTEGVVTLTVCNPNQSKVAKEEEERAKGGDSAVGNGVDSSKAKEPEKPKEPEPPKDPKDCEISEGRETTIEFPKDKDKAIGITIAGGTGTPLGGIVILEVFPEGAAGKDGRLKPGDQIIEICHESFKAIEHAKAHEAILKAVGPINMIVYRDNKPPEEFDVELSKKSGKGVGLCLTGFKSGKGAYVSDMLPGGSALESGKITKGDRVVAVGGQDVREAPVEDIALHVKVSNPVQLKLARYKPAKQ